MKLNIQCTQKELDEISAIAAGNGSLRSRRRSALRLLGLSRYRAEAASLSLAVQVVEKVGQPRLVVENP